MCVFRLIPPITCFRTYTSIFVYKHGRAPSAYAEAGQDRRWLSKNACVSRRRQCYNSTYVACLVCFLVSKFSIPTMIEVSWTTKIIATSKISRILTVDLCLPLTKHQSFASPPPTPMNENKLGSSAFQILTHSLRIFLRLRICSRTIHKIFHESIDRPFNTIFQRRGDYTRRRGGGSLFVCF